MAADDEAADRAIDIASLKTTIAEQDAQLAELAAQLAALTKQVELLTELVSRNSKNSHLPPSSDGPGSSAGGAGRGWRSPSGRKRGGQKGRRGSHRELLAAEQVDTFVELFPEVCLGCARPLAPVVDAAACRHQQLDLKNHRPHVTEWRRYAVDCLHCGGSTRAAYDGAQIPSTAFGPCLTGLVVYDAVNNSHWEESTVEGELRYTPMFTTLATVP